MMDRLSGPGSRSHDLLAVMSDEGLRLFFPLLPPSMRHCGPCYGSLLWSFGLPLIETTAPGQWHAQEMIIGSFGAALLGFLTSALPEWTETPRLRGRPLFVLAGLWAQPALSACSVASC